MKIIECMIVLLLGCGSLSAMNQVSWRKNLDFVRASTKELVSKHKTLNGQKAYFARFLEAQPKDLDDDSENTEEMSSNSQDQAIAKEEAEIAESSLQKTPCEKAYCQQSQKKRLGSAQMAIDPLLPDEQRELTSEEKKKLIEFYSTDEKFLLAILEHDCTSLLSRVVPKSESGYITTTAVINGLTIPTIIIYISEGREYQRYQRFNDNYLLVMEKTSNEELKLFIVPHRRHS